MSAALIGTSCFVHVRYWMGDYGMRACAVQRIQGKSSAKDKTLILNEIEEIVCEGDKVHIIDLCAACWKNLEMIGDVPAVSQHLIV